MPNENEPVEIVFKDPTKKPIVIGEIFSEAWKLTKENIGFLIGYEVVIFVISLIMGLGKHTLIWAPWHILGQIIVLIAYIGLYKSCLMISRGVKPAYDQLYLNWRLIVSWLLATLMVAVMFIIGLALLVIPALYVLARFGLYYNFIVDKGVWPVEAIMLSSKATEGARWDIAALFLCSMLLNFIGLLCLGVGIFVTWPMTVIAFAIAYNRLTKTMVTVETV